MCARACVCLWVRRSVCKCIGTTPTGFYRRAFYYFITYFRKNTATVNVCRVLVCWEIWVAVVFTVKSIKCASNRFIFENRFSLSFSFSLVLYETVKLLPASSLRLLLFGESISMINSGEARSHKIVFCVLTFNISRAFIYKYSGENVIAQHMPIRVIWNGISPSSKRNVAHLIKITKVKSNLMHNFSQISAAYLLFHNVLWISVHLLWELFLSRFSHEVTYF